MSFGFGMNANIPKGNFTPTQASTELGDPDTTTTESMDTDCNFETSSASSAVPTKIKSISGDGDKLLFRTTVGKESIFGKVEPDKALFDKKAEKLVQSTEIDSEKLKTKTELLSLSTCSECNRYSSRTVKDIRNQHFSQLLLEELQYIQPCMRTQVYAKILNFLHTTKKSHFDEIDMAVTEKIDEVLKEDPKE